MKISKLKLTLLVASGFAITALGITAAVQAVPNAEPAVQSVKATKAVVEPQEEVEQVAKPQAQSQTGAGTDGPVSQQATPAAATASTPATAQTAETPAPATGTPPDKAVYLQPSRPTLSNMTVCPNGSDICVIDPETGIGEYYIPVTDMGPYQYVECAL